MQQHALGQVKYTFKQNFVLSIRVFGENGKKADVND